MLNAGPAPIRNCFQVDPILPIVEAANSSQSDPTPWVSPPPAHEMRLNRLLAALPQEERWRWAAQLESVQMPFGKVLTNLARPQFRVFSNDRHCVTPIHHDGRSIRRNRVVGDEGIVGVSLVMGGGSALSRAVVRVQDGAIACVRR